MGQGTTSATARLGRQKVLHMHHLQSQHKELVAFGQRTKRLIQLRENLLLTGKRKLFDSI